jgi:hypothetical protein
MSEDSGPWNYDRELTRKGLEVFRDRYFRNVIKYPEVHLTHFGDCEIHRAFTQEDDGFDAYCSCGFFHDMCWIDSSIADKLYDRDKYHEELGRHGGRKPGTISDEEMEKFFEEFEKQPGVTKVAGPSEEQWAAMCIRDWDLIEEVFGVIFRVRRQEEWEAMQSAEA